MKYKNQCVKMNKKRPKQTMGGPTWGKKPNGTKMVQEGLKKVRTEQKPNEQNKAGQGENTNKVRHFNEIYRKLVSITSEYT